MDFNFLRNYWFGTTSADPDNASSELDSVKQSTSTSLGSFQVISGLKVEKEGTDSSIVKINNDLEVREAASDSEIIEDDDNFEFINLPDENEIHSLPYCKTGESVAEIAGFNKEKLLEMCTFSKMTYGNNDTKLSESGYKPKAEFINEGYSIIPFYSEKKSYSEGKRLAGFVFTKGKEVTIAYRGTKYPDDVMIDLNAIFSLTRISPEGEKIYNGRVHRGFHYGFQDSWPSLYKILATNANEQKVKIKDLKFNFTGHSMGGAIAKIAALYFNKKAGAEDIHVATFGDPRVFDLTASEVYNDVLQEKTITVAQDKDPVPMVAPCGFGYDHVGKPLTLEVPPTHGVHRIDGYYQAINDMEEKDFKSNNTVSFFSRPARILNQVNCAVLGNAQYYADNLIERIFGESKNFFEKIKEEYDITSWFKEVKIEKISSTCESFLHITRCL
ncbi:lipase family protein [Wolbachia endosymbiont of Folsomia candida]|uniref:lipase family protein n=1 Tax=Wolbachia endosymbiont of Folsomia candida TaxID=169402 RepID=UPI000ACBDD05|nr:lipase family protein [Wolbachia endosymbiont of Folsomia candida]APR97972.1 lipase family protein [Wolbachia endosymbiont of Folsomia candida]